MSRVGKAAKRSSRPHEPGHVAEPLYMKSTEEHFRLMFVANEPWRQSWLPLMIPEIKLVVTQPERRWSSETLGPLRCLQTTAMVFEGISWKCIQKFVFKVRILLSILFHLCMQVGSGVLHFHREGQRRSNSNEIGRKSPKLREGSSLTGVLWDISSEDKPLTDKLCMYPDPLVKVRGDYAAVMEECLEHWKVELLALSRAVSRRASFFFSTLPSYFSS